MPTEARGPRRRRRRPVAFKILVYAAAILTAVIVLAPFVWLLISSVASPADLLVRPLRWIPRHMSIGRYRSIFASRTNDSAGAFRAGMINSAIVAASTVAVSMSVGVFGAYAFARLRFRFRRGVLLLFLSTYMLPPIAILIPLYLTMVRLHLLDTRQGLVIVYCSFVTPYVLWILSGHFSTIPRDLEDAARIDGASRMGALFRVVLPIARPGLLATALFGFLLAWDEFLYALIFTSSTASKTIPVTIAEFQGRFTVDFGLVAAGGILASIPPLVIALVFQRYIVSGLASGAVKG